MEEFRSQLAQFSSAHIGDPMPFCYGVATNGKFFSLDTQAGRPAVIVLIDAAVPLEGTPFIDDLIFRAKTFATLGADTVILGNDAVVQTLKPRVPIADPLQLVDCPADCLVRNDVPPGGIVVMVIDRNRRVALRLAQLPGCDILTLCHECLDRMPYEPARDVVLPAPVLQLPHLIDRSLCDDLIRQFEAGPSFPGGMASVDGAGSAGNRIDTNKKCRRDFLVPPDGELHAFLQMLLLRRCVPEMARAFQARIAHVDRILIARYDAASVGFLRHRDNLAANVAFREFAISVNLNTEEYDGGHLLFPEYNDHRYCPPTGGGLIFSASLLHEATPVTRGSRYVLLTFFHGSAAEARRNEYLAKIAA